MTAVVLRHEELPGQPIVIDVPPGGSVSLEYKAGGWWIDPDTSAQAASDELAATIAKIAAKAAEDGPAAPTFEAAPGDEPAPVPPPPPADVPSPTKTPAPPVNPAPASDVRDTPKEK